MCGERGGRLKAGEYGSAHSFFALFSLPEYARSACGTQESCSARTPQLLVRFLLRSPASRVYTEIQKAEDEQFSSRSIFAVFSRLSIDLTIDFIDDCPYALSYKLLERG